MAARLSFYFLLAFFPFLIFLSAIIGFIPIEPGLLDKILAEMNQFLPERTYTWVRTFTLELISHKNRGVVSLGILLALWWASVGFSGMVGDLNRALAIEETRSYVKIGDYMRKWRNAVQVGGRGNDQGTTDHIGS